jgi:hypothetical protein
MRTHGVEGKAPSTLAARAKAAAKKAGHVISLPEPIPIEAEAASPETGEAKPKRKKVRKGKHVCPECGEVFSYAQVLSRHRRYDHDVIGPNAAPLKSSKSPEPQPLQLATQPPKGVSHAKSNKPSRESRVVALEAQDNSLDPLTYALAVGQLKELCRHIAEEHDQPTRLFTRQLAELFLREARR